MKTFTSRMAAVAAGTALIVAGGGAALAADPESGKVSTSSPTFSWVGSIDRSYPVYSLMNPEAPAAAAEVPCEEPQCDSFALDVTDGAGAPLEFAIGQEAGFVGLRITHPDGTVTMEREESETADKPAKFIVPKAAVGTYQLAITNNSATPKAYQGKATLKVPGGTAPKPQPSATPAPPPPSGDPGAAPAPQPSSQPTTMSVAANRASARKIKKARALRFEISVSAPVTGVVAKVLKGKKTVATGKLARVEKVATMSAKARRGLKKGRYKVVVTARDAQNRLVTARANLKVGK